MAKILPSLKEKKRYIAFESINKFNKKELDQTILRLIGEIDYAKAGYKLVITKDNKGIIQVTNKFLDKTKAALGLAKIKTLYVSGLINKAKKHLGDD